MQFFKDLKQAVPHSILRRVVIYSLCFWVPLLVFIMLADEVREREPLIGDVSIINFFNSIQSPVLDNVALIFTELASSFVIVGVGISILAWLAWQKRWRDAIFVAIAVGGTVVINTVLKLIFARNRPEIIERIIVETGYSFPSGHSMIAGAVAMTIIILCWHTKWRVISLVGGIIFFVMVGMSRIYLGVHYPSDVVAGWCVSVLWVFVAYKALGRFALSRLGSAKELSE